MSHTNSSGNGDPSGAQPNVFPSQHNNQSPITSPQQPNVFPSNQNGTPQPNVFPSNHTANNGYDPFSSSKPTAPKPVTPVGTPPFGKQTGIANFFYRPGWSSWE